MTLPHGQVHSTSSTTTGTRRRRFREELGDQMKVWFRVGNIVGGVIHLPSIPRWPVCIGPLLTSQFTVHSTRYCSCRMVLSTLECISSQTAFSFHNKQSWPSTLATAPPSVAAAGGRRPGAELAEGGELTLTARAGNLSMVNGDQ